MQLKPEIALKARKNDKLINALAEANGNRFQTAANWFLPPYSSRLTQYKNLNIIAQYLGLQIPQMIDYDETSQMAQSLIEEEKNH